MDDDPYSRHAAAFFERYQALDFEQVHRSWLDHLPSIPGFALDVGAGSGRDAAALAGRGWEVLAVEPAEALREQARAATRKLPVQWMDDSLPELARVRQLSQRFDLILVSAVWFHLPPAQRERAFRKLTESLAPGGTLIVTLRHGPDPDDGRPFYPVERGEVEALGQKHALVVLPARTDADVAGRDAVHWETVVFRLPDDGTGALPLLRHVIVNDDKSSSYKLGLLRCIVRIADSLPGVVQRRTDTAVEIPFGLVGLYWIKLYQPLLLKARLSQNPGSTRPGFAKEAFAQLEDISPFDLRLGQSMEPAFARVVLTAIRDACLTIKKMPAHYITYPGSACPVFEPEYRSTRITEIRTRLDPATLSRFGTFRIPVTLWDACSRYACWVEPAIVNEWSELLGKYNPAAGQASIREALEWEHGQRDTSTVRQLIERRRGQGERIECVWTARGLRNTYEVDHCFPWSRWSNNDLWNLLPATRQANQSKGEKLPATALLEDSRERITAWWEAAYGQGEMATAFYTQARAALPVPPDTINLDELFEGVVQQRLRLKMNQQLAEWYGVTG